MVHDFLSPGAGFSLKKNWTSFPALGAVWSPYDVSYVIFSETFKYYIVNFRMGYNYSVSRNGVVENVHI